MNQNTAQCQTADNNLANIKQWLIDELNRYGEIELSADGDYNYIESGLLDSMNTLKFLVSVQQRFAVQFKPEQMTGANLASVNGLIGAIAKATLP